jgi:hypothetical protein
MKQKADNKTVDFSSTDPVKSRQDLSRIVPMVVADFMH